MKSSTNRLNPSPGAALQRAGADAGAGVKAPESTMPAPGKMQPNPAPVESWFLAIELPQDRHDAFGSIYSTQGHAQVIVPDRKRHFGLVYDMKSPTLPQGQQRFTVLDPKIIDKPDLLMTGPLPPGGFARMEAAERAGAKEAFSIPYSRKGEPGTSNCLKYSAAILEAGLSIKMPEKFDYGAELGDFYKHMQDALGRAKVEFKPLETKISARL